MSRVSSFGDCKKDDADDPEERRLEDDRGLFHVIEQLAALEGALWNILDGLKSNATHVSYFCREYWGTSASHAQLSLERLGCNERLKRQVQQACVLESLSLGVASHLCSGIMQGVSVTIRSRLRNLLYYIHENCLVLLDMVCQRWLAENPNRWAESERSGHCPENLNLDILVRVKRYRRLRKGEHIMALRQHNEMIANVVRQLCRGAASKRPPLSSRSMGSPGDRSPGVRGPGGDNVQQSSVLLAVNDILAARMPLDRLRASAIRSKMLQYMRFKPLLNIDGSDPDCPWPAQDPYERYGAALFAQEGPTIWFEPLPPMLPDLEMNPKLPPAMDPDVYTLVLDLDETLVHYFEFDGKGEFDTRPGMKEFIERMHSIGYECVIFTAATQDYADWVIDQIDPNRLITNRLYRQHALPWGPIFVKDMSRLGRDLDRLLIIDNVQENFMLQPHNGIFISTWYDDPHDTALFGLTPLLDELISTRAKVPDILDKYRDQIPSWAGFDQYSQLGGVDYYDEPVAQDEGVLAPPPVNYNPYGQVMQTPQGVDSAGGFRSDASAVAAMRQEAAREAERAAAEEASAQRPAGGPRVVDGWLRAEASPPASPPNPPMGFTSPALNSSPHAAAPMAQQTYLPPEPALNVGPASGQMAIAGTGPAVSSSYVGGAAGGYDSYMYLPQRSPQGGYPQVAKPQVSPQQQQQQPPARPPAVRQAAPAAPQLAGQAGPHRTLPQASGPSAALAQNQASPQRAPAARPVAAEAAAPAAAPQMQMRPTAPSFSSVSGPYQSGPPPQAAQPAGAAMWGRSGLGPHQAQPLRRR